MLSDKDIKKKYKPIFWKDPDKYFATEVLKEQGYIRGICEKCHKPFWSTDANRSFCGDPACIEGESFSFIGKTPAKKPMTYVEIWQEFAKMFKKLGYAPIKRYPVVARWNPTMEYTNASIAAFQPYVISGEVDPPANPLVIPQFCLRFGDIDNVGITMSHNTGFVMIGQHMFVEPEDWDQNRVFRDIQTWIKDGLGLPNKEVVYHEDAWAGGGNLGCCMEFFSRGCELGNQVYMLYEQTPKGVKDLKIKVLDMGMGMERNAWFSQGSNTIYDAIFPNVIKKLKTVTGFKVDEALLKKFVPYAGLLNLDEVDDINKAWQQVSKQVGMDVEDLKKIIIPLSGIYSVAEHSRSLLFALSDGALPSNVGGGYNLRVMLRRALAFIDRFNWHVSLPEVCNWHADYLKPIFPELKESLNDVSNILDIEKKKYRETKKRSKQIIRQIISKKIDEKKLVELYDTHGINPELVTSEADAANIELSIPENFYGKIAALHEASEQPTQTKQTEELDLKGVEPTEALYFDHYDLINSKSFVLKILDNNIILNKTVFYPTSGGQLHDLGTLNGQRVLNVFKQGAIIIHALAEKPEFKEGDMIKGEVDIDRRLQLAQHHTAAHIINGAARKLLGNHIWQAGASKSLEKARLDITHFSQLSEEDLKNIEDLANDLVKKNLPVYKSFMPRNLAEIKYGFRLYQGGAVPGKKIRVVEIPGFDIEACGGTHLNTTGECQNIRILKTSKIQDGVVRIEFAAGKAAENFFLRDKNVLEETANILGCATNQVPARAKELFEKWKTARKAVKKNKKIDIKELELVSKEVSSGDILNITAICLNTQPEHLNNTIKRFLTELEEMKKKLS